MSVGLQIKAYIENTGRTQSYVSKKTGISPSQLNHSLNGKRKITVEEYELICKALEIPSSTFLGGETQAS